MDKTSPPNQKTGTQPGSRRWAERMRARNPKRKYDEDPEEFYNELDAYDTEREEELSRLRDFDDKMRSRLEEDPRLAAVISTSASGGDVYKAIFDNYGEDIMALKDDPEYADEIAARQQRKLEAEARRRSLEEERARNLEESSKVFRDFMERNKLGEEEGKAFFDQVAEIVDNVFMGRWTPEMCERLYKGLNYDTDVQAASDMGAAGERNRKIRAREQHIEGDQIPSGPDSPSGSGGQASGNYGRTDFFKRVR